MQLGLILILFLLSAGSAASQSGIEHRHIRGNMDINKKQNIHILSIPLESLKTDYSLVLAWSDSVLIPTSEFAKNHSASAAINGGFFNVKEGGSVSYLEIDNERVSKRSWRGNQPDLKESNINGALILDREKNVRIEEARKSKEYLNSNLEKWVLVSGPLLINKGERSDLNQGGFVENRHPRTCVGKTDQELLLITIDGRHRKAKGMSLIDVQDFLIGLGCIDAINLDGGGSTTMWIKSDKNQAITNCPSDNGKFDNQGERKVANALLLIKN